MTLDDYKDLYDHEWQRREQLQSAANTPISIVTLLGGGLILMAKAFETAVGWLFWPFWLTAAVAAVLLGVSVVYVIRSLHGWEYERLPYASDLAAHFQSVKDYYTHAGRPGAAAAVFEEYLTKRYIEAIDQNAENNLKRGNYLHRGNRFLVYGLGAATIAAMPAAIVAKTAQSSVQDVRITNLRSDLNAVVREGIRTGEHCPCTGQRPDPDGRTAGRAGEPQDSPGP